jgi:hypothetical protein
MASSQFSCISAARARIRRKQLFEFEKYDYVCAA